MGKIITDKWGTWEEITEKNKLVWRRHIHPSQKYIDEVLKPAQEEDEQNREKQNYLQKRGQRIQLLGEARAKDPDRIAAEDIILSEISGTITTAELDQIVSKLGWIADKTFAEVDNYIATNITSLAAAKDFLRIHTKITLAIVKLLKMLLQRELPPEIKIQEGGKDMQKFILVLLLCGLFGLTGCFNGGGGNRPPYIPSINLPSEAIVNEEVKIAVRSVDPDRNELAYRIRFGDGDEAWSNYHPSGQEVTFTHKYKKAGDYGVTVRAFDRKIVSEWSEEKWIKIKTSHPQRKISILWMGDEKWLDEFGGTHIVGFSTKPKPDWYPPHKIKLVLYLKTDDLGVIRDAVLKWRDHPNLGGYWFISGHEPDITGGEPSFMEHKKLRRKQYELVRFLDPDKWNHPVMIFYNCTGAFAHYPGWQNAFPTREEGRDCDIFLADIYANRCDGNTDYEGLKRAAEDLVKIGLARSDGQQFIPCLGAFVNPGCKAASLLEQWEFWVEWYREQTGEELRGVAYYFSGDGSTAEGIYSNERLQREAKEINKRLGLLE